MPLDPKLTKFTTTSPFIISYGLQEALSGRAILKLYLCDVAVPATGASYNYQLTEGVIYSQKGWTRQAPAGTLDLDFDIDINQTLTLAGAGIFSFPIAITTNGAWANAYSNTFTAILKKVAVGGGETTIATGKSTIVGTSGAATEEDVRGACEFDIPLTTINRGEKIRVTITSAAMAAGFNSYLGHDPKNRSELSIPSVGGYTPPTWTTVGSEAFVNLPVVVEI